MSDKTSNPTVTAVPAGTEVAVKQPNWLQRKVVTPIKSNPKIAIAVAAGVGLVASAAFAGRKSAQYDVVLELQPAEVPEVEPITVIDTSSSDE